VSDDSAFTDITMSDIKVHFSQDELELIWQCLDASVRGDFFPEWEFQTIFGVDRNTVRVVLEDWPLQTVDSETFTCAVINSLNNLVGYPHGMEKELYDYISAEPDDIKSILTRLVVMRK
jgi:hypothetical protein